MSLVLFAHTFSHKVIAGVLEVISYDLAHWIIHNSTATQFVTDALYSRKWTKGEDTAMGMFAVLLTTADYLCGRIPTHTLSTMKCGPKNFASVPKRIATRIRRYESPFATTCIHAGWDKIHDLCFECKDKTQIWRPVTRHSFAVHLKSHQAVKNNYYDVFKNMSRLCDKDCQNSPETMEIYDLRDLCSRYDEMSFHYKPCEYDIPGALSEYLNCSWSPTTNLSRSLG